MGVVSTASPPPRCFSHDLAVGPDGRCVICRKSDRRPSSGINARVVATMLVAVLAGGALAFRWHRAKQPLDVAATEAIKGHVRLYTTGWCPHCKRAKSWLAAQHIEYEEIDLERDPRARRAHRKLSPRGSIPTLDANGVVVVGFDEAQYRSAIERGAQNGQ